MKVKKAKILKNLKNKKSDKRHVNLWVSGELFERFKKACGENSASKVIEEMMRDFLGD